jgi:uncharacterized lipoprotein YajG
MGRLAMVAALLTLAACQPQQKSAAKTADSSAAKPAPTTSDTSAMKADSTKR